MRTARNGVASDRFRRRGGNRGLFPPRASILLRAAAITCCLIPVVGQAQLVSPGKLASVHASLEGVDACTKCHNFGEKTFRRNCLACHVEIGARIARDRGYHANTRKLECSTCHKEHHGREFKLIRWDPKTFDHRQTGLELAGKHAKLECRQCHTPNNIVQKEILRKKDAAKRQTYLGLEPECANCHGDRHRGQLGADCARCHTQQEWTSLNFSHAKTRFPLIGKHAALECGRCHPALTDTKAVAGGTQYAKYKGIPFRGCLDCHKDTHHKGAFGNECANCHSPADWKIVRIANQSNFDHAKTDFPLQGKHANVTCGKCHTGGEFRSFAGKDLSACLTCHDDYHRGQFATDTDRGDCKRCHDITGFTPSRFEAAQHKDTRFPLRGAHRAIPCDRCHKQVRMEQVKTIQFRWESFACTSCHGDPHAGQFATAIETGGCESCHTDESWHAVSVDHSRTTFPLTGKHRTVACDACHVRGEFNGTQAVVYKITEPVCERCHRDPHQGQLADTSGKTACARCHSADGWKDVRFDHNTMSRFALTGKHASVPCTSCHRRETGGDKGAVVIRFKPLETTCTSCHGEQK